MLASKPRGVSPSQRFRVEQWARHLADAHNIRLQFAPFESTKLSELLYQRGHFTRKAFLTLRDFARRGATVADARNFDAVVIHREAALIGPAIYERLLAWSGKPILFDFDDAIWMQQPEHRKLLSPLRFQRKTKTICRLASIVTAGNEFLAAYARQYNSAVEVVPTTIELADYPLVPEPATDGRFVVCWTGSTTTLVHFEHVRGALEQLAELVPLTVKVICNKPPERAIAGAETRFVQWSPRGEARELGDCHVGIMPLPDNGFTRGKCGLKALQYMATGRPVVASPVGVNGTIIEHGRNGYLAANDQEWVDALMKLAASPELRARLGSAGRERVQRDYSAPVGAAKFAAAVRAIA